MKNMNNKKYLDQLKSLRTAKLLDGKKNFNLVTICLYQYIFTTLFDEA